MTTYTLTEGQRVQLLDAQNIGGEHRRQLAIALLKSLQPNTQEPRTDTVFGGPKAREQMLNQLVHPAPQAKPLTDEQIKRIWLDITESYVVAHGVVKAITRAIEAAHGVKP